MATPNICTFHRVRLRWLAAFWLSCALPARLGVSAAAKPATDAGAAHNVFAARARAEYDRALTLYRAFPEKTTNAIQLARTAFDWAEFATSKAGRTQIANQGIQACRRLERDHPELAEGPYYMAMNLGELAQTRSLGALSLVDQMEINFKKALQINPLLDFAGPDRSLGLLYHEAPGWPVSIGSKLKARQHLQSSVRLSPEYPGNHLDLLEALLAWRDLAGAKREIEALNKLLPAARTNFTGVAWAQSWQEWEARWKQLEAEADSQTPGHN